MSNDPTGPVLLGTTGAADMKALENRTITVDEVALHVGKGDAWTVVNGLVLDISKYLSEHPGDEMILQAIGKDATYEFMAHHGPHTFSSFLKQKPGVVIGVYPDGIRFDGAYARLQETVHKRVPRSKRQPLIEEIRAMAVLLTYVILFSCLPKGLGWCSISAAFLLGMMNLSMNGMFHSVYHGRLKRWSWTHGCYHFLSRSLDVEFMRCVYYPKSPLHLRDFRSMRQRAYCIIKPEHANVNLSHHEHHAHTNGADPLDPEFHIYFGLSKLAKVPFVWRIPRLYASSCFQEFVSNPWVTIKVTSVMMWHFSPFSAELWVEVFSSIVNLLFGTTPFGLLIFVAPYTFALFCFAIYLGKLFVFSTVLLGGHKRNTEDYVAKTRERNGVPCSTSWGRQQADNTFNVVKPFPYGIWQFCFAFDYPLMVEHHLAPGLPPTMIQEEVAEWCRDEEVPLNLSSIADAWSSLLTLQNDHYPNGNH